MNQDMEPNYYLVRTIPELVEQGIVGVGWVDFHFDEIGHAEEAIRQIDEAYGIGRYGNQVRRFFHISADDFVVAPIPHSVAIGRATGGLFFDHAYYDKDRANQRRVDFPRDQDDHLIAIPRSSFSEAFQRRLKVPGVVVNDLGEFADEIEAAHSSLAHGAEHSWVNRIDAEISRRQDSFKKQLLENIQSGRTNLRSGGVGLENLVRELLEFEGYRARILPKKHFEGLADADVQASRSDHCAEVRLLLQVKHHHGYSDAHGIRQLQEIQNEYQGDYGDHRCVFVTSASVSEELLRVAADADITVVDGMELAEWITENIDRLPKETKLALGICEVPAVV